MKDQDALPVGDRDHLNKTPFFVRPDSDDLVLEGGFSMPACDAIIPSMVNVLAGTSMFERMIMHPDPNHGDAYFV